MPVIEQITPLIGDPIDLKLGPDNDLVIENGDLVFVYGVEGVAQCCKIALQLFEGEVFFDQTAGIPYLTGILGARAEPAQKLARTAFMAELLSVQGVLNVVQLEISYIAARRRLAVVFRVSTIFGDSDLTSITLAEVLAGTGGS